MDPVIITPKIYQVPLKIVNVFLIISADGLILVDTGPAGSKAVIFDTIRTIGFQPADIKHIIVTHSHHDHSGSLADILTEVDATVYMHPEGAEYVRKGVAYNFRVRSARRLFKIITIGSLIKLPYLNIKPVQQITEVNEGDIIPGPDGLQVIHAPGHSPGQIALYYPGDGGIILTADSAENLDYLRLPSQYVSRSECLSTIKKLIVFEFRMALFSHGEPIMRYASENFKVAFGLN
jgi:glyoxylase-like metal-dependent hydrolase (beta-lactamase superfamily II)